MLTDLALVGTAENEALTVDLGKWRRGLAQTTTLEQTQKFMAGTIAFEVYQSRVGGEAGLRLAREMRADVERHQGSLIGQLKKSQGARNDLGAGSETKLQAIKDAGFNKKHAFELQKNMQIPDDQYEAAKAIARESGGPELDHASLVRLANGGNLAAFSSESVEWYTPAKYIEAAREVLGYIDLDPASNPKANEVVKAKRIFTSEDSGIDRAWEGRVWLNPPYGDEHGMSTWVGCMLAEYELARMKAGILLCNAVTDRNWFQPLWDFPICFTNHRIQFYTPSGQPRSPVSGNAFVYFGKDVKLFAKVFAQFGAVVSRVK